MNSNIFKKWVFFLALIILPSYCFSDELFKFHQVLMGTVVEIMLIAKDRGEAENAAFKAFQEIQRIEKLMSTKIEQGDVFRINKFAGRRWVSISSETLYVINKSIEIAEISDGGFDITIGPLIKVWDKVKEQGYPPSDEELKKALSLINFRDIMISPEGKIFLKKEGMSIDLGGIAKGYAVDRAFNLLKNLGYKNLIVNAGGDLRVGGTKFGELWSIGIQDPRNSERVIAKISLNEGAIATSGDYERYFIYERKRYHHILNPRNGLPAEDCRSVTVFTQEGIFADGMATAIFVLGPKKGYFLCQKTKGVECLIVDKEGDFKITQDLKNKIQFLP